MTAQAAQLKPADLHTVQAPADSESGIALPLRGDTFLGVCEAIGQDFGFNPNFLRIPFAALILWNPAVIIGSYLGLGGIVALTRWLFPVESPKTANAALADDEQDAEERLAA